MPTYTVGAPPAWRDLSQRISEVYPDVRECLGSSLTTVVNYRLAVQAQTGTPMEIDVATYDPRPEQEACIGHALRGVRLPHSSESYTVVAQLDPNQDLLRSALQSAELALRVAKKREDEVLIQAAQREVWALREQVRLRAAERAAERARQQAAKKEKPRSRLTPMRRPSPPRYESQHDREPRVVKSRGSRPKKSKSESSTRAPTWEEVEAMRDKRRSEERAARERRDMEVRRMDWEARRRKMEDEWMRRNAAR